MAVTEDSEIFRTVLDGLFTGVYLVDRHGKITFWNEGAERITGYLRQDVLGRKYQDNFLAHSTNDASVLAAAEIPLDLVFRETRFVEADISLRHKAGHRVPVHLKAIPIRDRSGVIVAAAESFEESVSVSEWDRRRGKLSAYGCLDESSGVLNHGMMQSHLREQLSMFAEHPMPFSILCFQIDNLDLVRARHGPGAVAAVVKVVAQTLENSLRPTDFLGRWRDNEFLAIVTECNSIELLRLAERLHKMMGYSRVEWWGDPLSATISIGGSAVHPSDTPESMMQRAEEALKESAAKGGNRSTINGSPVDGAFEG